ncbi:CatB-related O-acetyltransferase [Amaricoccus sp.]|uniref:CatB-related O-acetyltransferase n=1 Tax=Amaricoccus sp. TaxID=1872485 RepID=UPI001B5658B1|nr:CatB-related O-acetyltransferase [Amaricoccus sp.]MBP7242582.1 CatB-related O-acetyltransferase [Amaricoccus sp.]
MPGFPRVGFLKPLTAGRANVEVGRFSYYDDPEGPEQFFERNVLHHYDFVGDRLVIGSFCAIATGVRFFMNGANHAMDGFSTFPFNIFGRGWERGFEPASWERENRGDTVVGHDVWIGAEALILPGARIGSGAIVGARAVVSGDVPPYAIALGNPARVLRLRFDAATIAALLRFAWWDWPVERITAALGAIRGADIAALERAAG